MIAKDLMPWMFVGRKSAWTPFAKVRSESGAARRKASRGAEKKKAPNPHGFRAFLSSTGD